MNKPVRADNGKYLNASTCLLNNPLNTGKKPITKPKGGIGSLIFTKARQGQIDKVFAVLIVIVLIGFIQDRVFAYMDKRLYPHKYETIKTKSNGDIQIGILLLLGFGVLKIMQEIFWSAGSEIFNPIVWIGCVGALLYILYGEFVSKKIVKNV